MFLTYSLVCFTASADDSFIFNLDHIGKKKSPISRTECQFKIPEVKIPVKAPVGSNSTDEADTCKMQ